MALSSDLHVKIIRLLIYFDVLLMPLSTSEVYRFLPLKTRYQDVVVALHQLRDQGSIACDRGFYFLAGRNDLVGTRLSRYALSLPRLKRAWIFARVIAYFPWVEGVALYSSTSFFNAQKTSDLDLLIVSKSGRVWSCRFWVTLFLKLFRLRPAQGHKANKLCVSFLIDRAHLDVSVIAQGDRSGHYLYGTSQFIFLSGDEKLRQDFFRANAWIADSLPQWEPYVINSKRRVTASYRALCLPFQYLACFVPEFWYRQLQMYILPDYYKKIANCDTRVILNDYMIKLHHHDGRDWVEEQLKQRYASLNYEVIS